MHTYWQYSELLFSTYKSIGNNVFNSSDTLPLAGILAASIKSHCKEGNKLSNLTQKCTQLWSA
jgi:hypothetical protein